MSGVLDFFKKDGAELVGGASSLMGKEGDDKEMALIQAVTMELILRTFGSEQFVGVLLELVTPKIIGQGAQLKVEPTDEPAFAQRLNWLLSLALQGPSPQILQAQFTLMAQRLMQMGMNPQMVLAQAGMGGGGGMGMGGPPTMYGTGGGYGGYPMQQGGPPQGGTFPGQQPGQGP